MERSVLAVINKLMGGISRLLYERFGEDTVIYQDEVPQGFPEPYFFLLLTEASTRSLPNRRGEETDSLEHAYFPEKPAKHSDLFAMAEDLMRLFQCVTLMDGSKTRGRNFRSEIVDGVLHVFADYVIVSMQSPQEPPMEQASLISGTGKGEADGS